MNIKLQQQLLNKYPQIFKKNNPSKHPFDQWGFESWDGWYDLIDRTASKIQKILDNDENSFFDTWQNKQKLSALRWYFDSDKKNEKLFEEIIDAAEEESMFICEECGVNENVTQNKEGYILTLCNDCRNKKN